MFAYRLEKVRTAGEFSPVDISRVCFLSTNYSRGDSSPFFNAKQATKKGRIAPLLRKEIGTGCRTTCFNFSRSELEGCLDETAQLVL